MADKKTVFKSGDTLVGFTKGAPAVYETDAITGKKGALAATEDDATKEKLVKDPDRASHGQLEWIPWGDGDDFPTALMEKLGKLGVGKAALENNADMHYGLGVKWWYDEYTTEGKRVSHLVKIDDWTRLEREENMELEQAELIDSLEHFYIGFVQVMLNKNKDRVNWTKVLNTPFVRFKKQLPDGNIPGIVYSSDFPHKPKDDNYIELPLYDRRDPYKYSTFVLPVYYSTWGKVFYPEPDYYTVIANKWVDVAITVPELIHAINTNFATLKYHIKIPKQYFLDKYKNWDDKTEEEQLKLFTTEQDDMNAFLTGTKNAGKAFVSIYGTDADGKEVNGWIIEPIKNYLEVAAHLPNNDAANHEILFAMNHDPSMGLGAPGKGNETGSGSDKRVARSNKVANMKRARLVSLQVPKLIAQLNGYYTTPKVGPDLYPDYLSADTSQPLDVNPTGSQTVKQ